MKRGVRLFKRLQPQRVFAIFAAVLVASFTLTSLFTTQANAATDATWNGDSILYNQNQFIKQNDVTANDGTGLPTGTHIYTYTEAKPDGNAPQLIHVIEFPPNTDTTTATSAQYVTYDFTPPSTFTNPTAAQTISISQQSTTSSNTTSCVIKGIGWIICPLTDFFAGAMDWLFNVLSGFMAVRPVQTSQDNALFRAWSMMRNFANVAFVIAFLIIIYSQVTTIGISNYGIKKILPRLIVSAVLVNISYWICAVAVDVSNILGYSVQDIFIAMRNSLVGNEGNSWHITSWGSISGFILSGGTALTAFGVGAYAFAAGAGGAIYLLLPILVSVLMAVLVALLIVAARQAIITILIILSPLAFVAYILPSTEKLYKRWHELGSTMLIMFPAFSFVFGGSQLAGTAIIQNADSINLVILGMAVQVAPLAITPFLLRFSGSLLGRIAGMANNPSKGLVDRTRNWAQQRADDHKGRALANTSLKRRNVLARSAQAIDARNRRREGWRQVYQAQADNRWHDSEAFHAIDTASREAARTKQMLEQQHNTAWNIRARIDPNSLEQELRLRVTADQESLSKLRLDTMHEELKAGTIPSNAPGTQSFSRLLQQSEDSTLDLAVTGLRKQTAERKRNQDLVQDLLQNTRQIDGETLREYAGGVMGTTGAESILAKAVADERKEYNENIQSKIQLIKHFNLDSTQRQDLAMGVTKKDIIGTRPDGTTYQFKVNDDYAREAAIEMQLKQGAFGEIQAIVGSTGAQTVDPKTGATIAEGVNYKFRTSVAGLIKEAGVDKKAVFLGSQTINDIAQGKINGDIGLDMAASRAIKTGKISAEDISTMKKDALKRLFYRASVQNTAEWAAAKTDKERGDIELAFNANMEALKKTAWTVVNNTVLKRNAEQESLDVLNEVISKNNITSDK